MRKKIAGEVKKKGKSLTKRGDLGGSAGLLTVIDTESIGEKRICIARRTPLDACVQLLNSSDNSLFTD